MTRETITLDPRETWQGREHEATTFWLRGARARYGDAYFVSTSGDAPTLWRNCMPYAPNVEVCTLTTVEMTWDDLDGILDGALYG